MPEAKEATERQRYWMDHARRCEASGQSVAAYAADNGLPAWALYEARRRLRERALSASAAQPRFVRVAAGAAMSTPLPCRAHLRNGVVIELGVGATELGAVLRELAALS